MKRQIIVKLWGVTVEEELDLMYQTEREFWARFAETTAPAARYGSQSPVAIQRALDHLREMATNNFPLFNGESLVVYQYSAQDMRNWIDRLGGAVYIKDVDVF